MELINNSESSELTPGKLTQLSTESTHKNSVIDSAELKLSSSILGNSTISLSSVASVDWVDSVDSVDEDTCVVVCWSKWTMEAAEEAAVCMSRGEHVRGLGRREAMCGKLRMADLPLMERAATSWARAAISGVAKVPSHMRDFLRGSRISDTHLPQLLILTPW